MPRLEVSIAASVNYNAATAPKIFGLTNYWEIATGLAREREREKGRGREGVLMMRIEGERLL